MKRVKASLGYTMNLGNFESLRFDYGVEVDIKDNESLQDGLERAHAVVEKRLHDQIEEEMATRGKQSGE